MKVAIKVPVVVVINGDGSVVTSDMLPKSMVTVEVGSNPAPVTVTEVPTGPEDGSRKMIGVVEEVTVNVVEAKLALTVSSPIDAEGGTLNLAENFPLLSVVTVPGITKSSKVIATGMLGANPVPDISTGVPTGPEVGLSEMVGFSVVPDVPKFHSQLESTAFESKQSKKLPFWSSMLEEIDAI